MYLMEIYHAQYIKSKKPLYIMILSVIFLYIFIIGKMKAMHGQGVGLDVTRS